MSKDYITGNTRLSGGPAPGTGEEDVQMAETTDLLFGDNEELKFGDDSDVVIKWDASNLTILPLVDDTGAIQIGNGTLSMDLKVFGTVAGNYFEYDASEDRLNLVVASRAISGEEHALDISYAGTVESGDSMVGLNVAVTPAGASASWVSAIYGKVTSAAGVVGGYFCAAEFEINITGSQPCAYGVLVLNSNADNSTYGQTEAYVLLREYGSKAVRSLFNFMDHSRASESNSVIVSQTGSKPFDTAIRCTIGAAGTTGLWLLASTVGPADANIDFKMLGSGATNYIEWDASADVLNLILASVTGSSEHDAVDLQVTSDNTYITGTNITYSGARGSAIMKLTGTASMASGAFEGIDIKIATSGVFTTDGEGVMGVKCVVTNSAALTDGEVYGGQFIAKHAATGTMLATASLIGLEAWAYISSSGPARTCIGGNFGFHNECSGAYGAGSVIRGIQIFCDNVAGAQVPVESTGLCIWNQAGLITNAINVVNSGSGFTNFVKFTDDGEPASLTNGSTLNDIKDTANAGWIQVTIGSTVRYIAVYAEKA